MSVQENYEAELAKRGYRADPAQLTAIDYLERCCIAWSAYKSKRSNRLKKLVNHPDVPQGVYLYGGVGRGKSFLMDCFYEAVPLKRKTRLHFHEFMREVHRELQRLQGTVNPLDVLGEQIAEKYKLICFDEFHVANITDAMILHRLLAALWNNGVGFVMTSNFAPDELYPNGLQRERILPAIELIKQHMQVVNVDYGIDYRTQSLVQLDFYHYPLDAAAKLTMQKTWEQLRSALDGDKNLLIEGRILPALECSGDVVWYDFKTLCDGPRSQNDYLELANRFHTIMLSGVPQMTEIMASAARRFTWLVDVLYDRKVKLVISAAVPAEQLYTKGPLAHEFVRTVSRLEEMRSPEYLATERRVVDTQLTE